VGKCREDRKKVWIHKWGRGEGKNYKSKYGGAKVRIVISGEGDEKILGEGGIITQDRLKKGRVDRREEEPQGVIWGLALSEEKAKGGHPNQTKRLALNAEINDFQEKGLKSKSVGRKIFASRETGGRSAEGESILQGREARGVRGSHTLFRNAATVNGGGKKKKLKGPMEGEESRCPRKGAASIKEGPPDQSVVGRFQNKTESERHVGC